MAQKVTLSLHLEKKQLAWLEEMVKKYNLPSAGKALRICFTYTKQAGEDAAVFAKVPSIIADNEDLVESSQEIDDVHDKYLQSLVETYSLGSKDKASRVILDYVMTSGNEATIFEVKRCKHGDVCKNC
ncbi:uncharacterized protein [Physcomitrium patens]|uniref:Uncharacterized protein n=1 Tax=Physcomitrium patens TaxID=3218 RepID=A0A2K1J0R5_PHYPA|nr:uncharacterized protein LOC112294952 [Physcomitrium patens]XP_024401738.1 uncharacterized protein LOC112294952 [Physcomitrium patens]PNR35118.1 hypothetical protein PHYPA_023017 [Physcomitrium patens]|eukprot:XP_024401737.1 uncharacterized protein LOC112294952 [Physcomitrella patens]